jgi:hypothetical protein
MKKILIIVIIILIIAFGGYVYLHNKKQTLQQISPATSSQTIATSSAPVSNSGWQTYSSPDFTIKYPTGWTIMESKLGPTEDGVLFTGPKQADTFTPDLRIFIYKDGGAYNDSVVAQANLSYWKDNGGAVSTSTIAIDGTSGTTINETLPAQKPGTWINDDMYVLFQKGNAEYQIQGDFEQSDPAGTSTFSTFYNSLTVTQ